MCCNAEPFKSFNCIKLFFTNFDWVKNWIFLTKDLSLMIVFGKAVVSHAMVGSATIVMSLEKKYIDTNHENYNFI